MIRCRPSFFLSYKQNHEKIIYDLGRKKIKVDRRIIREPRNIVKPNAGAVGVKVTAAIFEKIHKGVGVSTREV